jgi:hypothetical protein
VVHGWPHLMLVVACDGRGEPHARTAHHPLKALLVPLFATLDALPAAMGGHVGCLSLTAARGHLPASLGWTRHDCLVASGVLGSDVVRCLKCVPEEVVMLTLVQAPSIVLRLRAHTPLVSLAAGLWLITPALPPQRGLG